jgi:glutamate N-acetyltransferase/amino-acid N-acetyltransferase
MEVTDKGICCQGFKANGVKEGKYGVAIILSEKEANCALMLTSNRIRAAPLIISKRNVGNGKAWGIVANSGNANAYTGEEGLEDAKKMCELVAKKFDLKPEDFAVASTGVIGRKLEIDKIEEMISDVSKNLKNTKEASLRAAEAIMTTDNFPKLMSVKTLLKSGAEVEIGGIAKGAGMIAPDLRHATMMCFLTTNAYVPEEKINQALKEAVDQSFNMTVVDGDTSTNDIAVLLANGIAGNRDIDKNFQSALNFVTRELAKMIAKDGEGATKFIEVQVRHASSEKDAKKAARAVAGSNLVKTAVFGRDPNWGRIIAAVGYSGAEINPDRIGLYLKNKREEVCLIDEGKVLAFQGTKELKKAEKILGADEIYIIVDLHIGEGEATAWGCDLTYDYVKINAEYMS